MASIETDGATRAPLEPVAHFTVSERAARGKAARAEVPRSAHASWEAPPVRADPVELLEEQAKTRVEELVPIRYGRMLVSPFTFYRGAAYIMAADLAGMPRTGLHVQLCGDAHLSNFGVYAAPDRRLVFDTNDFDETLPGPFEWDVKRLVASFAVAGRDRGFDERRRRAINLAVSRSYREAMAAFASMRTLDLWYSRIDIEDIFARLSRRGEREGGQARGAQRREGPHQGQPGRVQEADARRRRRAADRQRPAADRPDLGALHRRAGDRGHTPRDPRVPADAARRPPPSARALPARRRGPEGRGRRERRDEGVHPALPRPRRRGSAVPPDEGGAGVGARAVPRQERVRQPRPAGGRGAAADAGRERHDARLDPRDRRRRRRARLLPPPALGFEGIGADRR